MSERDPTKSRPGASRSMHGFFLKIIMSQISGVFTVASVRELAKDTKPRFQNSKHWSFDAQRLEKIDKDARNELLALLKEFHAAGGKSILLCSKDSMVRMFFQILANHARLPLRIAADSQEFSGLLKETRALEEG